MSFERLLARLSLRNPITSALVLAALAVPLAAGCGQEGRTRDITSGSGAGGAGGTGAGTGGAGGGALNDPLPLRVLNWNVHNFLNDKNDSAAIGEVIVSTADYVAHRKAIGAVIAAMDPDIAVLQEVENEATLTDLVATELGGKYSVSIIDGNDPRGIDIGMISKIPIDTLVTHRDDSFVVYGTAGPSYQFSRDCPEYHLSFNGRKLILLGAHLKAKESDNPAKRLAEAQRTRVIADSLAAADPSAAIAVLGDFNDTPGSPPYLAVLGAGAKAFTNAPESLPTQDQWSYDYLGKLELVDHQMSNPLFAAQLDKTAVTIRRGNDVDAASDHMPVMATYMVQ